MKTSSIVTTLAAFFTPLTHAASIGYRENTLYVPPDIYANEEPTFAGQPILLSPETTALSSISTAPSRNQHKWAVTYTPYTDDGGCKSATAIASDVASISAAGFSAIRLYATDCDGLALVGDAALQHDLRLIVGIHVGYEGTDSYIVKEQLASVVEWIRDRADVAEMLVVGHEAVFNEFATPTELVALVRHVRDLVRAVGFTGPITAGEPTTTIVEMAEEYCAAVDVVAASLHPFFHADVAAESAGDFAAEALAALDDVCGGTKETFAFEVGWPKAGTANDRAVPGVAEQRIAVEGMVEAVGSRAVLVSWTNEGWRDPGDFGVEEHVSLIASFPIPCSSILCRG